VTRPVRRRPAEAEVRRLVERWLDALHAKDLDRLMSLYTPDTVFFDAVPPLRSTAADYRANWERYLFEWYPGPIAVQVTDVHVVAGDHVAFARALVQVTGTDDQGRSDRFWTRLTAGYQKTDGGWHIAHEHWSVPVDGDSGKACLHLEPDRDERSNGMTPESFRRIALGLGGAVEKAHHGHPDFRVDGRVFATLGYPDKKHGMVALTPAQQRVWVREHATAVLPVKGVWGAQGATLVRLQAIDEETLGEALTLAWRNAREKGPSRPSRKRTPVAR
jgi:uncharacterized protein (TIGR02246 family)